MEGGPERPQLASAFGANGRLSVKAAIARRCRAGSYSLVTGLPWLQQLPSRPSIHQLGELAALLVGWRPLAQVLEPPLREAVFRWDHSG